MLNEGNVLLKNHVVAERLGNDDDDVAVVVVVDDAVGFILILDSPVSNRL